VPRRFPLALLGLASVLGCERPLPVTRGIPGEALAAVERWLAGEDVEGPAPGPAPARDQRLRALGAEVYRLRCTPCHGVSGNGRGPQSGRLSVPARDFTTGVYELRSTPSGALPRDEDLYRTVSRGLRGTAMLPWSWLTEVERWAVVGHVKSFSDRFESEGAGPPVAVPPHPTPSAGLEARGTLSYRSAGCPSCHGERGDGDGPSAGTLRRDSGEPVRPRPFSEGRFLRGSTPEELWLTLHTGLDGTPMPSYETLPADDLYAIGAEVRALAGGGGPRGEDAEERLGFGIDLLGR